MYSQSVTRVTRLNQIGTVVYVAFNNLKTVEMQTRARNHFIRHPLMTTTTAASYASRYKCNEYNY